MELKFWRAYGDTSLEYVGTYHIVPRFRALETHLTRRKRNANRSRRWVPFVRESLFCDHESRSLAANLAFMESAHSFFVPYRAYVADELGLFSYLQEKICRANACLYCRASFGGREACLQHMADRSHRKLNFERTRFRGVQALELAAFYDFARPASASDEGPFRASYTVGEFAGEDLVTASGARRGTRHFARQYKQKYRVEDTRLCVRSNLRCVAERRKAQFIADLSQGRRDGMRQHDALVGGMALKGGNCKALAAQFVHKKGHSDNAQNRAIVHHWGAGGGGSHYNMAGCKKVLRGQKAPGLVSRHSKQAAVRNGKKQAGKSQAKKSSGTAILM